MKRSRISLNIPRLLGLRFRVIAGKLRSVYQQLNGEVELADVCTCELVVDGSHRIAGSPCGCCGIVSFRIVRRMDCPIDEHKLAARSAQEAA